MCQEQFFSKKEQWDKISDNDVKKKWERNIKRDIER